MSRGVLLQIAAFGNENIKLTGNPQISFFKSCYKRHSLFAMNDSLQYFEGDIKLGHTQRIKINKSGDLLSKMWFKIQISIQEEDGVEYSLIPNLGFNIIEYVEFFIGRFKIEKLYGEWMFIYYQLNSNNNYLINKITETPNNFLNMHTGTADKNIQYIDLQVPIPFWFCNYISSALPIVALQNDEISLNFKFKEPSALINQSFIHNGQNSNTLIPKIEKQNSGLYTTQIWLSNDERKYLVNNEHTYLIEQIQINDNFEMKENNTEYVNKYELNFNHPVKALFWIAKQNHHINFNNEANYRSVINVSNREYSEIDTHNLFSFILNYFINKGQDTNIEFLVKSIYTINIESNGTINIINKLDKSTNLATSGTKINVEYLIFKSQKIKNILKYINNLFHKIEISVDNDTNLVDLDIKNHFKLNSNFSSFEKNIISSIMGLPKNYYKNIGTKNTNLFESVVLLEENTNLVSNKLNNYIHHDHNIYTIGPNSDILPIKSTQLFFNNLSRTENLPSEYYNYIEPLKYDLNVNNPGINMYSFCNKPFDFNPSGNCNFSKIEKVSVEITQNIQTKDSTITFYALNNNLLKILNGTGNILFN